MIKFGKWHWVVVVWYIVGVIGTACSVLAVSLYGLPNPQYRLDLVALVILGPCILVGTLVTHLVEGSAEEPFDEMLRGNPPATNPSNSVKGQSVSPHEHSKAQ